MKALSLLQPWANLVVMGVKTIETRSWTTAYRGELLIHASLGKAGALLSSGAPFKNYIPSFDSLPFGAIIGQVSLVNVHRLDRLGMNETVINRLTMEERAFGDYSGNRYC